MCDALVSSCLLPWRWMQTLVLIQRLRTAIESYWAYVP